MFMKTQPCQPTFLENNKIDLFSEMFQGLSKKSSLRFVVFNKLHFIQQVIVLRKTNLT